MPRPSPEAFASRRLDPLAIEPKAEKTIKAAFSRTMKR
jgi:hypothetical protein